MLQPDEDHWPKWEHDFGDADNSSQQSQSQSKEEPVDKKKSISIDRKQAKPPKESLSDVMKYASLGTELFAAVLAGTLLGWFVSWLVSLLTGSKPVWIIAIGVVIGALAGFLNMYRVIVELEQKEEQEKRGSSKK